MDFVFYYPMTLGYSLDLQDRSEDKSDGEVDSDELRTHPMPNFIPHALLKRKIARTNARLLR